jgi:MFS transporter, ACDE family, multidrug resistance protein
MGLTALLYNWGFFTVLGYAPFPLHLGTHQLGYVFTGWGVLVGLFAIFGAPWIRRRLGIARALYLNLALFAVDVLVIGIFIHSRTVTIVAVIVSGIFIGTNNTITTQAVMTVSPVERPVASASYGFIRFIGGGIAPWAAGKIAGAHGDHLPFYICAGAIAAAIAVLASGHSLLGAAESAQADAHDGAAIPEPFDSEADLLLERVAR